MLTGRSGFPRSSDSCAGRIPARPRGEMVGGMVQAEIIRAVSYRMAAPMKTMTNRATVSTMPSAIR